MMAAAAPAIVVMGVCGAGKTTIGRDLAAARDAVLLEADDFHPPANIAKMSRGEALSDADRAPWLAALAAAIAHRRAGGQPVVATCSALKRAYRDALRAGAGNLVIAYLEITPAVAAARLAARRDHFMPASLVPSQFAALEDPRGEVGVIVVDGTAAPATVVAAILADIAATTTGRGV